MIVYRATNRINGKVYIGQTVGGLNRRMSKHIGLASLGNGFYLHKAMRKYGAENFEWEVIRICDSIESLNAYEQYYILYYDSMTSGYNQQSGGKNCRASKETKEKMSKARLGKPMPEKTKNLLSKNSPKYWLGKKLSIETRQKMSKVRSGKKLKVHRFGEAASFYGKKHTEESKEKMRIGHLGKKASAETKIKMSIARTGEKNHNYGKRMSDEQKKKISQTQIERGTSKGKNHPMYGKHHSEATKQKIRIAKLNISKETRKKMRESRLKYLEKQRKGNHNEINKSQR